jgi:purine-nucleoside phosphorylase
MEPLAVENQYELASEAVSFIQSHLSESLKSPSTGIICGSGLGGLADTIEENPQVELPYGQIPHFPQSTGEAF